MSAMHPIENTALRHALNERQNRVPDRDGIPFRAPHCRIYQPSPSVMQSDGRN